ncbi:MAG: ATP-binding protein [Erysipelotrichaceae bacterium]|nr:ATP-binding protein [Erysipelotrichaceae bacterium]
MKTLIILSALPGSGKSYFAKRFCRTHKNVFIVSSDELRKEIFGSYQNFTNEPLIWKTYLERIRAYGDHHGDEDLYVIADSTNLTNAYRKYYYEETRMFDKHVLVVFEKPWEMCLMSNMSRRNEKQVPLFAMEKLRQEYESPSPEIIALYDEYIYIDRWFERDEVFILKHEIE